jgi:hypothetical protein
MPQFQSSGLLTSKILESLKDSTDQADIIEVTKLKFIGHECYLGELFMLFVMSYSPSPRQRIIWDKHWTRTSVPTKRNDKSIIIRYLK